MGSEMCIRDRSSGKRYRISGIYFFFIGTISAKEIWLLVDHRCCAVTGNMLSGGHGGDGTLC